MLQYIFEYINGFLFNAETSIVLTTFWSLIAVELLRTFLGSMLGIWPLLKKKNSLANKRLKSKHTIDKGVSVILASHNTDRETIQTVLSLREQTIKKLQIIVVNDCSTDHTDLYCQQMKRQGLIDNYIHMRTRAGKAAALNGVLQFCIYPYTMICDTGTTFHVDAIEIALSYFDQQNIAAVAFPVGVRNEDHGLLAYVQKINYFFSCLVAKNMMNFFGFIYNVSGCSGIFRTDVLKQIGGMSSHTGEDFDLILKLKNLGWDVDFSYYSIALTDVPTTLKLLIKQRLRWDRDAVYLLFDGYRRYFLSPFLNKFEMRKAISILDISFGEICIPITSVFYLGYFTFIYGEGFIFILLSIFILANFVSMLYAIIGLFFVNHYDRDWQMLLYIPLFLLIQLFVFYPIKLWAFYTELVFWASYQDSYLPQKVQSAIRRER